MYIYFPFIRYALLKNQFHSDEMNPKASTAASSGRNRSNESDSEGDYEGSHINDSNCGSNISSTKMTTAVLNSTYLPFKMAHKKKSAEKNCHVNGNFEIESIIILLLTSSWLPFVVYNKIIKKMWKERPNRIGFTLLFNRIETIFNAFIEQIIKNSIENTMAGHQFIYEKRGHALHIQMPCVWRFIFLCQFIFFMCRWQKINGELMMVVWLVMENWSVKRNWPSLDRFSDVDWPYWIYFVCGC